MTPQIVEVRIADINTPVSIRPVDQAHVAKLAESIALRGLDQPIVVHLADDARGMATGQYDLGPGRHRMEAFLKLGRDTIPAIVKGPTTPDELVAEQVAENLQRKDLTPLEEADLCANVLERVPDVKQAAAIMGRSVNWMESRAALTRLSAKVRKWVVDGSLPLAHARIIARLPNSEDQEDVADTMRGKNGEAPRSLYHVEGAVEQRGADLSRVTWELAVPFGATNRDCASCPFNGANTRGLFDDAKEAKQACLDLSCFKDKTAVAARGARKCANWLAKEKVAITPANAKKAREAREVLYVTIAAVTDAVEQAKKDAKFKASLPKNEVGEPITVKRDTPQAKLESALNDWGRDLENALAKAIKNKPLAFALIELFKATPGVGWRSKPKHVQALLPFAKKIAKVDGTTLLEVAKLADASNPWIDDLPAELMEAMAQSLEVKMRPKPTLESVKVELAKKAGDEKAAAAKKPGSKKAA